jgi:hypothetical protein
VRVAHLDWKSGSVARLETLLCNVDRMLSILGPKSRFYHPLIDPKYKLILNLVGGRTASIRHDAGLVEIHGGGALAQTDKLRKAGWDMDSDVMLALVLEAEDRYKEGVDRMRQLYIQEIESSDWDSDSDDGDDIEESDSDYSEGELSSTRLCSGPGLMMPIEYLLTDDTTEMRTALSNIGLGSVEDEARSVNGTHG